MGSDSFEVWAVLPASPEEIYEAWLDESAHKSITGAPAAIDPSVGGRFTAWDGYVAGTNRELEPGRRILQAWRTTEFADDDPDSMIELLLVPEGNGTRVTLRHTNIPVGQGVHYQSGWHEHYFEPMARYFSKGKKKSAPKKKAVKRKKPAPKKKAVKKKPARNKARVSAAKKRRR